MDLKKARLMVVEDEKIMRTFILSTLRRIGFLDLHVFEDGASALGEVSRLKPDLILTDVHMHPVGGLALLRSLRSSADPLVTHIPVIFLTVDSTSTTVGEALPLGLAGYIVKPPNQVALMVKIEHALRVYKPHVFSG